MNIKSSPFKHANSSPTNPENILQYWVETTAEFYGYYSQLTSTLQEKAMVGEIVRFINSPTGNSTVNQAIGLLKTMEIELEILLIDIDGLEITDSLQLDNEYRKLDQHTRRLRYLNQQAKTMLSLTALSTENNLKRSPLN